ncbi:MAG TPA: hypothetical protein VFQ35_24830, partial [Polyangiaceae bacterium]|nr:hypothetical protein [Polyangiaceae bacterium]
VASATGPLAFTIDAEFAYLGFAGGVRRSNDRGLSFTPLANAPTHVGCVTSRASELYVCGFANNEFAVWSSPNQGDNFRSYLRFSEVTDGVACPSTSTVSASCSAAIADWQVEHPPESVNAAGGRGSTKFSAQDVAGNTSSSGCQLSRTSKSVPTTSIEWCLVLAGVSLAARWTQKRSRDSKSHG